MDKTLWPKAVKRLVKTPRFLTLGGIVIIAIIVFVIVWSVVLTPRQQQVTEELAQAQQYYAENDLLKSRSQYQSILNRYPNNYLALNGLGNVLRDQGELGGAEKMYLQVIAVQPQYEFVYRNLLTVYQLWSNEEERTVKLSEYDALIQKGLAADKDSVQIMSTALDYYRQQGDTAKVNELEQKLSDINQTSISI